jgi:cyanobactin maturation PatA/PatG family protease
MITELPDLKWFWNKSRGDPNICIAVLDGPVDQSHPCFDGASLVQLPTLVSGVADQGFASQHGTHVASIIFGQHDSPVPGIAPDCRGLIIPVFVDGKEGGLSPCSQIDLARAITQAVEQGANVINISGGQLATSAESDQLLANAVRLCEENNVLIVAAAGNDGCECLHIPAALKAVLAVGAMDPQGNPSEFSNWGGVYQSQGILAPGGNILGARPGGGTVLRSGTSFAAPIVSGIAALFLSIQLQRGAKPDPHAIRTAILQSALPCNRSKSLDSRRCLAGTLNIPGAYTLITTGEIKQMANKKGKEVMIQPNEVESMNEQLQSSEIIDFSLEESVPQPSATAVSSAVGVEAAEASTSTAATMSMQVNPIMVTPSNVKTASVNPSGADGGCGCGGGSKQIVYALGELGTDFGTEARRDSFTQLMPPNMSLLDYLLENPWEAQSLIWTLQLDATPIYAILPTGSYASVTYERLRSFLADEDVERVSIPGYIGGSVRLLSGQVVPVIIPEIRGMYSWSVQALVSATTTVLPEEVTVPQLRSRIEDYLNRVYYDYRNLGVAPQERALNFSATNAFQVSVALATAAHGERVLDTISVEKSPICRPDSDCYDVKLIFFDPENDRRSNRVYRFTIDVSDVIPVPVGQMRSWSQS